MKREIKVANKTITLIETAHVSAQSVQDVLDGFDQVQPDCICIELDPIRYQNITNPTAFEESTLVDVIRQKKLGLLIFKTLLSQFQKKIAQETKSPLGQEMLTGIQLAKDNHLPLGLIDRDVQTTFKRIWRQLGFKEKLKLFSLLFDMVVSPSDIKSQDIEDLKDKELLDVALQEISSQLPTISAILVDERDQVMALNLLSRPEDNIMAIVGAAHAPGIQRYLNNPKGQLDQLLSQPKKPWWKLPLQICLPLILVFAVVATSGLKGLGSWMLWVSLASGLGALVSLAHPLTILVAIICAPISTLSPILTIGWFVGLCQASLKKPKVKDLSTLSDDLKSIHRIFQNRILHTLVVMVVTSVFSSLVTLSISFGLLKHLF